MALKGHGVKGACANFSWEQHVTTQDPRSYVTVTPFQKQYVSQKNRNCFLMVKITCQFNNTCRARGKKRVIVFEIGIISKRKTLQRDVTISFRSTLPLHGS